MCIRSGIRLGTITKNTRIIAAEKNTSLAPLIREELKTFDFVNPPSLYPGPIQEIPMDTPIQFVNLDLNTKLNLELANFLPNIRFSKNATMVITLLAPYIRTPGRFLNACRYALEHEYEELVEKHPKSYRVDKVRYLFRTVDELHTFIVLRSIMYDFDFRLLGHRTYADDWRSPMIVFRLGNLVRHGQGEQGNHPSYSEIYHSGVDYV